MLMNALSEDCSAVQSAISEKARHPAAQLCSRYLLVACARLTAAPGSTAQVANFVQQAATFIAGIIVGAPACVINLPQSRTCGGGCSRPRCGLPRSP